MANEPRKRGRSRPITDRVDDDLQQTPQEGVQPNAETSPQATEGPGQTDAASIFQEAASNAVSGGWKERRDAWDHREYNPEFHLGPDRQNADGTYRVRRAPGDGQTGSRSSGSVSPGKARPLPVSTVEMFLISSHAMLAGALELPELALDKDDANNLAVPITKVAALYDLKVDPRLEAYGMLIIAILGVYGPKVGAIYERKRAENAKNVTPKPPAQQRQPATVSVLHPTAVKTAPAEPPKEGNGPPPMSPDDITKLFGGEGQ